jgi:hypothetical protein
MFENLITDDTICKGYYHVNNIVYFSFFKKEKDQYKDVITNEIFDESAFFTIHAVIDQKELYHLIKKYKKTKNKEIFNNDKWVNYAYRDVFFSKLLRFFDLNHYEDLYSSDFDFSKQKNKIYKIAKKYIGQGNAEIYLNQ